MAKSKKHNRAQGKSQSRPAFYEALPMFIAPSPSTPLSLTPWRQPLHKAIRSIRQRLTDPGAYVKMIRRLTAYVRFIGLSTTNSLLHHLHNLYFGLRITIRNTSRATLQYLPALFSDVRRHLGRISRLAFGKKARLAYLVLTLAGLSVGGYLGVQIATRTLDSYANDISSPAALLAKKKTGTTILDRNGNVLFEGYGAQATQTIPFAETPQMLAEATVAAEDPHFYDHPGFSWRDTLRAAWVDITHGSRKEGGSTLTQQLVKNALLTSDKKFERKFQEVLLSIQLEKRYDKQQILEMYLNETYYGQGASGVEAASQTYFHKSARKLSLGESALIAGLPLGPSRFDPNMDIEAAQSRRDYVINRLLEFGKITKTAADEAKAHPLVLAANYSAPPSDSPEASKPTPIIIYKRDIHIEAPHFVFYVLDQLRKQYGDKLVEEGGLTVKTTLDLDKQHLGEHIVADRVSALAEHHVTNGGLVSITPTTGDILSMVGSIDYNAPGFGNVNVILSELQPGSSFKPIAYVTAFKKGWNGATHVDDTPFVQANPDGTFYVPQNYDGKFRGSVSLRQALANSLNIPAIKVLQFAGIHDTIQTAHDLGITSLNDESRYGLALVLGGGEVRPLDMATVYATFANGGINVPPRSILQVADRSGKDITKANAATPKSVLDPRIVFQLTHILSDNAARTPEFGANSPLKLSRPAAAKTGTTNDFRDNWTAGYTPSLATVVWVGNNDHSAMNNIDGITGAAPIWHDYMEGALNNTPVESFNPPAGVTVAKICSDGSLLSNPWDFGGTDEVFFSDQLPTKQCSQSKPWNPSPSPSPSPNSSSELPINIPQNP